MDITKFLFQRNHVACWDDIPWGRRILLHTFPAPVVRGSQMLIMYVKFPDHSLLCNVTHKPGCERKGNIIEVYMKHTFGTSIPVSYM